jgi:hypothetical protein
LEDFKIELPDQNNGMYETRWSLIKHKQVSSLIPSEDGTSATIKHMKFIGSPVYKFVISGLLRLSYDTYFTVKAWDHELPCKTLGSQMSMTNKKGN